MLFPSGWILPLLTATAIVSGVAVLLRPTRDDRPTEVWTFSPAHARELSQVAAEIDTATRPAVVTLAARAMDVRLQSLRASERGSPELVELEIGAIGKYFRGRASDVPFVPLTDRLRATGWLDRLSPARLKAWTHDGEVFAVPLDVHPVSLTYRKDLFDAADIDLATATTWPQLHALCLKFEAFERANGRPTRALQLPGGSSDALMMMLQQRGIDPIDAQHRVHLADPRVAATIAFYAQLIAGERKISADPTPGPGRWVDDLASGHVAAALTPDWALADLARASDALTGKLAMMPLPRFDPTDAPTASWGGTAVAIPRSVADPDRAWRMIEQLYLCDAARQVRERESTILPAITDWWDDIGPPNAMYPSQSPAVVYERLARQLPPRTITPFNAMASSALSLVLYRTTAAVQASGGSLTDAQLQAQVQRWLNDAAADLQSRIAFATLGS
ncbi:MAG TPA: extracellular solute-binding protein [Tepidisphaeraceae bacterium]|jgi:ABC-type glycerol-3-phosphate transport system substrate-binding protein|nr:extracellular solute-binding protein [Tepidisphaeraceae bacterium]